MPPSAACGASSQRRCVWHMTVGDPCIPPHRPLTSSSFLPTFACALQNTISRGLRPLPAIREWWRRLSITFTRARCSSKTQVFCHLHAQGLPAPAQGLCRAAFRGSPVTLTMANPLIHLARCANRYVFSQPLPLLTSRPPRCLPPTTRRYRLHRLIILSTT